MGFSTADLVDTHGTALQNCSIQFRSFGRRLQFHGQIHTVRCEADNGLIRAMLSRPGNGAVLVVDGGGLLTAALLGDKLADLAWKNHWSGLLIHGAVRDVGALGTVGVGIKALGSNPHKSTKLGTGEAGVPVSFGGANFLPGSWLYSDEDGLVVSEHSLLT